MKSQHNIRLDKDELESQGKAIGPRDMLIAAHALSKDLVLVTNNEKEFLRIKSLKVENWAKQRNQHRTYALTRSARTSRPERRAVRRQNKEVSPCL